MKVYDLRALDSAFWAYSGVTQAAATMRQAHHLVRQHLTPCEDGTYEVPNSVWSRAMRMFHTTRYSGRWVWKARTEFAYALSRALNPNQ